MPAKYVSTTISGSGSSVTGGPVRLDLDAARSVSFHQHWNAGSGTLAATTTFEASNDSLVDADIRDGTSTANWVDVSSLLTITSPTSGEGQNIVNFSLSGWAWVRLKCTYSSGSGAYDVHLAFNG